MNNVKGALSRKFGPLPAWAWFIIAAGALYFYRKYQANNATTSGTGTGSVAPVTPVPGTGEQVLEPGESIYDPTAGTLQTAPGGGGTDGNGNPIDYGQLATAIGEAIAQNMPQNTSSSNPGTNPQGGGGASAKKAAWNKAFNQRFNARFNAAWKAKQEKRKAGTTKRNQKGKPRNTGTTAKTPSETSKRTRARSTTKVRTDRSRSASNLRAQAASAPARSRAPQPVGKRAQRTPTTHRTVSPPAVRQHVQTAHPAAKPSTRVEATSQHRPSNPPPRTASRKRAR